MIASANPHIVGGMLGAMDVPTHREAAGCRACTVGCPRVMS